MKNIESLGLPANYSLKGCFKGCTNLKSFVIGNKVTSIGTELFSGCTSLETLVIGDGIEELKSGNIIYGCNIKNLYLGKNLKKLSSSNSLGNTCNIQKVYLFSDVLSEVYHNSGSYHAIPLSVEAIYVANPLRYETLLGSYYNLREMVTFNRTSLEYTGKTPEISYKNYVEGMDVFFDNNTTPKDAGSYNTNLDVTFSNEKWSTTIEIPCSYTITKAPLSIIANDLHRYYGEENPEFTSIFVGFKNGETPDVLDVQPALYTTATKESNSGTYPIYCSGAEAKNYNITYERGTLTINKAPQAITWEQNFSNVSIGDIIELTATVNSGLPVKYRSSDSTTALISSENGKQYVYILKQGVVAITANQPGDNNHSEANEVSKVIMVQATGIEEFEADNNNSNTYYDIAGQKIKSLNKGVNIIHGHDGSIRKVFIK